jgi:molybdopterin/thiamine biosynthesis adenylyltransferase
MNPLYRERFLRNIGLMDEEGLERIRSTAIAIGGLGLGGAIFLNLVRLGFTQFHIADPDTYDRTNINRQRLAKENTIGRRKDDCLIEEARAINPDVEIKAFREGVNPGNVEAFLKGVDWVIDVVDVYAMAEKLALNETARRKGLPVASCGSLGFSGSVIVFDSSTPSFAELAGVSLSRPPIESLRNFLQFIAPEVPSYMAEQLYRALDHSTHIPFAVPGVEIAAATAAAQVAQQVLGLGKPVRAPHGIFIDSLSGRSEIFEASYKARVFELPARKKKAA